MVKFKIVQKVIDKIKGDMSNGLTEQINNGLLYIGTGSGLSSFLVNADIALSPALKVIGIFSFAIHILLNRKKIIKEMRDMFNSCPVDEEEPIKKDE